jgi:hypothetical protein
MISTVTGLAYTTNGVPIKLALAVLPIYGIYALAHLLYAAIGSISSSRWESVAEVTALALASRPQEQLRNATAGITTIGLFREPVRICTRPDGHLELAFHSNARKSEGLGSIQLNRMY